MNKFTHLWSWLTDSEWRRERHLSHPALTMWRLLVFPFVVLTAVLHCSVIFIGWGPSQARDTWHDCTGL